MSGPTTPYFGVVYVRNAKHPWRASLVRAGVNLFLGGYDDPKKAADAVDNATYHLRAFTRRQPTYNFPENWTSDKETFPGATRYTINARTKLKSRFPSLEQEVANPKLTPSERLEEAADNVVGNAIMLLESMRTELRVAAGLMRGLEASNKSLVEENERLLRTVKGLQNMGGQQFFKKVGDETVPATPVEAHLG